MMTRELLKVKMKKKSYSRMMVAELVGCSDRAFQEYASGTTTYGPYLVKIMEILDISPEEWNSCENVKGRR